ncbi:hypothetical protein IFM89_031918 [Coptis chinensis]|uniref:LNS2/PITP domain-containing protein n=1 Tax=Coptis chinensis TaxID=261450 RepID=A0A835ISD0_9MAGN|nr:hypothetical protein IFM89_031918 [Coptis chinensis]
MYLQSVGVPYEESENLFLHHETSESGVAVNSSEQGLETLKFSEGECEESRVYAGTQSETAKLASEENTQPEYAALMSKHKPTTEELRSDDEFQITNAILQCGEISASSDTKDGVIESHSSLGKHSVASQYGDAGILELAHQETITERPSEGRCLQTGPVETVAERSQANGFSKPCVSRSTEVSLGEPSTLSGSSDLILGANNVAHFDEEAESQGVCVSSCGSNSVSLVKEEVHLGEEDEVSSLYNTLDFVGDPQGSNTEYIRATHSSNLLLENLGEAQFIFSDIDNHETSGIQCKDSVFPDSEEIDENPLMRNDVEDWNDKTNREHWSQLSSIKLIEECSPDDIEPLLEDLMKKSSPMKIPRNRKCAEEEVEWMIESLPNFRSHIDNLEMSDVIHPLSQSLDLHSESLRQEFLRKDVSGSSLSNLDTECKLAGEHRRAEDTRIWEEIKNMSNSSLVEISLCKRLLYEGMGADAASQVFDAGKVDLENFTSLDPQLMKNNDIIVRIGGRYFPWDAAASIISKMLSLGHDQSIVPEGMIDVDQIEKTVEGQLTRTNVPSGGSWSLWPFNFRRSRSVSPILPPPDGTTNSDCMNASVRTSDATGNKSVQIVKVAKKKVKSLVPTSEQLATLNLKEGRNVITFTFSTAMLGKQQVDARIYLWKWDTRIVVSDVDGTITRSDVLGQFMPLVGKDWSQTGVAHLFSAIKENGYQLLFLSARAISQAYLTRQFLFNLKQDGKALPDGPVVISPDGLFPSLFREGKFIRRAPHEFKIACLQDIRALFPPDCNPFYAGFGNRVTDEISYLKLGIPKGKIFTINAKGEVAVNRRFDRKSYTTLHALVDGMFPSTSLAEQEDFNSWNYWKMPLPDINS